MPCKQNKFMPRYIDYLGWHGYRASFGLVAEQKIVFQCCEHQADLLFIQVRVALLNFTANGGVKAVLLNKIKLIAFLVAVEEVGQYGEKTDQGQFVKVHNCSPVCSVEQWSQSKVHQGLVYGGVLTA